MHSVALGRTQSRLLLLPLLLLVGVTHTLRAPCTHGYGVVAMTAGTYEQNALKMALTKIAQRQVKKKAIKSRGRNV